MSGAAVDKALAVVDKVQKVRRLYKLLTLLGSSGLLIGIAIVLLLLIIVISLIPFVIFGEEENMTYSPSASRWGWMEPKYIDADGSAYAWPVPTISRISSYFGRRDIGQGAETHKGMDMADGAARTEL